ncbi:MAG: SPOR domain-containing protein [Alphaproteobacteria bacterium]|nr:SPOR domain-containing protein [Alphaproteobacteria bacterium]MBN2779597.1 SPOR domain-containing protein [Alphaproteobacteria bacterium]
MIDILNKAFRKKGVYPKKYTITGGYIVQLGAFSNLKNAQKLINQFNAAKKITIKKIDNKILYVALLTGLSYTDAQLKCSKLKEQGQDCFIKKP